MKGMDHNNCGY